MRQIQEGQLPFDRLPAAANDVQVFPSMQSPLIGCGKLATNGCGIWFDNENGSVISGKTKDKIRAIIATAGDDLLLAAPFDNQSLTWKTTVQGPRVVPPVANNVQRLRTKEQLCDYLHRAAGHPVKKTWLAAIKAGEYATWPGLTYELVSNHLPNTEETAMGHLHRRRQNIRSTKPKPVQNTVEDLEPELQGQAFINKDRTQRVGVHLLGMDELNGMISTDQTGRFPIKSIKGKSYIMVMYNYDSNVILATTMKSREAPDLVTAYNELHQQLLDGGVKPVLQRLDNEISKVLIKAIKDKGIDYQLASPHDHRLNPAERAIQTFKNHLIAILHGCDNKFPAWLWCQIIPQVVMTLNMLRRSRINPKLSAHTQIFGVFDYNRTPLAPIGTRTVVHARPEQRKTFGDHGVIGWTIGPAMDHYRHWEFYIPKTRGTRVSDTVVFLPEKYSMPTTSSSDRATAALEELTEALRNPAAAKPFLNTGNKLNEAISALTDILATTQTITSSSGAAPPRVTDRGGEQRTLLQNCTGGYTVDPQISGNPHTAGGARHRGTRGLNSTVTVLPLNNNKNSNPTSTKTNNINKALISGENSIQRRQLRPRICNREKTQNHRLHTAVYKIFEGGIHQGYICGFDKKEGYYKIKYQDGDIEEADEHEVTKLLTKPNRTTMAQALSATRFERMHAEYCKTEERMPIQSNFSNGFGKAVAFLDYTQGGIDDAYIPAQQSYKFANTVIDEETGKSMEYRDLLKDPKHREDWSRAAANEFGRLFNGVGKNKDGTKRVVGTNTCHWIKRSQVPKGMKVTYARTVVAVRPEKSEPKRVRITAGGDRLDYYGETSTETASLETAKILINSVLSTPGAKMGAIDVENFYIHTLLTNFQYMRFHISMIPQEIINEYNLNNIMETDGWCYVEIRKAMYGLKESGFLANQELKTVLAKEGYIPAKFTPGLYTHKTRPIAFSLVVDDFGVKYINKEDMEHLIAALGKKYPIKVDWKAEFYLGMTIKWDYNNRTAKLSMPGYVKEALLEFQHESTNGIKYNSPSPYTPPVYGKKQQMAKIDDTKPINKQETKLLQQVCGKFLYYARAIDTTMLHALNDLATQTAKGTEKTMEALTHFLNYCATHPDAEIIFRASDMVIHNHSDAAYLVASEARSRAGGFTYMGNHKGKPQIINGAISVIAKIIKSVMSSAAEAEVGALFMNAKAIIPLRITCEELGHIQPATPMRTDNNTAEGIMNGTIKQNRSKAIDMRFYWLKDRVTQGQFHIYWEPGHTNLGDYYTKHHPPCHHKRVRPVYTYTEQSPMSLQGCIELLARPSKSSVVRT